MDAARGYDTNVIDGSSEIFLAVCLGMFVGGFIGIIIYLAAIQLGRYSGRSKARVEISKPDNNITRRVPGPVTETSSGPPGTAAQASSFSPNNSSIPNYAQPEMVKDAEIQYAEATLVTGPTQPSTKDFIPEATAVSLQ